MLEPALETRPHAIGKIPMPNGLAMLVPSHFSICNFLATKICILIFSFKSHEIRNHETNLELVISNFLESNSRFLVAFGTTKIWKLTKSIFQCKWQLIWFLKSTFHFTKVENVFPNYKDKILSTHNHRWTNTRY